jgi:hypothetical protein
MNRRTLTAALVLMPGLPLLGCDAHEAADYRGEELFRVTGTITQASRADVPEAEAALVWDSPDEEGKGTSYDATAVATDGKFPARFSLSVYQPPPPATLFKTPSRPGKPEEPGVAIGLVTVVRKGTLARGKVEFTVGDLSFQGLSENDAYFPGLLGVAREPLVFYFDRDVAGGTRVAEFVGTRRKGFYLMKTAPLSELEFEKRRAECRADRADDPVNLELCEDPASFRKFVEVEGGLGAEVTVELGSKYADER